MLFSVMIHMVGDFSSVALFPFVPSFECDFVPSVTLPAISERD